MFKEQFSHQFAQLPPLLQKKLEMDYKERMNEAMANCASLQAGLRTLHEAGPEIKRSISVDLEEAFESDFPSTRR